MKRFTALLLAFSILAKSEDLIAKIGGNKMKRLVTFILIFSISIFVSAQDIPSLSGNFSLAARSYDNNLFCSSRSLFAENSFLYMESECQVSQIPRVCRFFEGHYLFRMSNLKTERRKGLQEELNSELTSPSLAEGYLKRLAERNKKIRKTSGIVGLGLGVPALALGAVWLSSGLKEDDDAKGFWGATFAIVGVAGTISGTLSLARPSRAERELNDLQNISDPAQKERAGHEALSSLAAGGRRSRILSSILFAGLSTYILVRKETEYGPVREEKPYGQAALVGAFAVYTLFIMRTPAEKAFKNYKKEKEQQTKLELRLGLVPYGGAKIDLVFSF